MSTSQNYRNEIIYVLYRNICALYIYTRCFVKYKTECD